MVANEISFLSAEDLRYMYERRTLSPVEAVEAILRRIELIDPSLNAYITVVPELALRQAKDAERALRHGNDRRPLLGVPISLKDLTPTRGIRTTRGSLLWQDWIPDFDAPLVERIYAAGGVILGKTNTSEFGWKADSGNRIIGPTHNPWRAGLTAGGSSGGAAAAVSAGMGPLAQGSDGAGSIRIPAAFCGVFGLKPSFGLVPYYPPSAVESLAHVGPISRTVRDAALMLNVLAGPDPRDRNSLNATGVDHLSLSGQITGLRVAWSPDLGFATVEPEIADLVASAVQVFEELGCDVKKVSANFEDPYPIIDTIWATAQAAIHKDDLEVVKTRLDPGRLGLIKQGQQILGLEVAAANIRRAAFCDRMRHFMEPYDFLLTPTLPVTPFAAGADHPDSQEGKKITYLNWTPFTYPFNLTGQPAATVPCGLTKEGLPVGLQIVGRWRDDLTVLRAAAAFEEARPWANLRPPIDEGSRLTGHKANG